MARLRAQVVPSHCLVECAVFAAHVVVDSADHLAEELSFSF